MESKYCTLKGTPGQIKQFLDDLPCDIDRIVELVMCHLEMYPNFTDIRIYLFDDIEGVQQKYKAMYSRGCDYKAFMDKHLKSIYIAVSDFTSSILLHELGHIILEYKYPRFPAKWHEDFAKHCARHVSL